MALNLDGIRAAYESGDFARPNLFAIEIPFLGRSFEFKCKAANMPAGIVPEVLVSYQNRKIKIAGDREFDAWTITVYNEEAQDTRQKVLDWMALAAGQELEITGSKPEDYKKLASVKRFNRKGDEVYKQNLYGCFPTSVGEVTLDWEDNNSVEMFEITIAYDYFGKA
ncbi:major tail protein [Paraglaciecola Antarctic GD virus 1]|nr:major tail protein [Paraglaciecola Antarctic GD virus 1]